MNALTRTAMKVVLPRARTAMATRTMATESRAHLHTGIPKSLADVRNSIWLSDAGAYPVIFVLTFAVGFCGSFMAWTMAKSPDVRVQFGRRQAVIRDWE